MKQRISQYLVRVARKSTSCGSEGVGENVSGMSSSSIGPKSYGSPPVGEIGRGGGAGWPGEEGDKS